MAHLREDVPSSALSPFYPLLINNFHVSTQKNLHFWAVVIATLPFLF